MFVRPDKDLPHEVEVTAQRGRTLFRRSTWSCAGDDRSMLKRLPKQLPGIEEMLLELGRPTAHVIAKALQVSPGTVKRWIRTGRLPRSAHLALYWLTHSGRADIEVDMHNELLIAYGLARAYERERNELRALLKHVLAIGSFGAANDPVVRSARL